MKIRRTAALAALFTVCSLTLATAPATAQTYRWIDPATGRTVISDMPPPPNAREVVVGRSSDGGGGDRQQSYAVKIAAERHPVTLYTADDCNDACAKGRKLLEGRGIPFSEKSVKTQDDIAELKQLTGGEAFVPFLKVGTQTVKGYEAGQWSGLLDAAGYPKTAPYGSRPQGAGNR